MNGISLESKVLSGEWGNDLLDYAEYEHNLRRAGYHHFIPSHNHNHSYQALIARMSYNLGYVLGKTDKYEGWIDNVPDEHRYAFWLMLHQNPADDRLSLIRTVLIDDVDDMLEKSDAGIAKGTRYFELHRNTTVRN